MEKTARKPSTDPVQEKLRQNKANWNKEVSAFINDLIHLKKTMNGWPSKFHKERSRIVEPIPADPTTIIGSLAGDFQDIVNKGNSVIQEQLNYVKTRRQRQPKQLNLPLPTPGSTPAPEAPKPPAGPDLSKQLSLGLTTSIEKAKLIKLAMELEDKYFLESQASNPFSRFITKLFTPKFGFGEGARIRRLRMTMLENCAKSYKALKQLHREIVKSSKESISSSHKMMTVIWNYWNIVNRLFSTYKTIKPGEVKDEGGKIEDPKLKEQRDEGNKPEGEVEPSITPPVNDPALNKVKDYKAASGYLGALTQSLAFHELNSIVEAILAAPKNKKIDILRRSNVETVYNKALQEVNSELGTSGSSFTQIIEQLKNKPVAKAAQLRWLGKARHQLIPGATSSSRLEVYNFIEQIKIGLNDVMDLLEEGFDQEKLTPAIGQVNRDMAALRTMMRSLYYSEKPEEISSPFF